MINRSNNPVEVYLSGGWVLNCWLITFWKEPSFAPYLHGFPGGSVGRESACNAGDLGLIPGLGRSPEEGKGYPLWYSGLENSTDCVVHGVAKSRTRLSDLRFASPHFLHCFHLWGFL